MIVKNAVRAIIFFYKETKKNKINYYKLCNYCKKSVKVSTDKLAYALYSAVCQKELSENCKDLTYNSMYFRKIHNAQKEIMLKYIYLYENLKRLFDYLFLNELMEHAKKIQISKILTVMKEYKNPLQEEEYQILIEELTSIAD